MNSVDRIKFEFNHVESVISGLGSTSPAGARHRRIARSILEDIQSRKYDRPGCYAYVGWNSTNRAKPPNAEQQLAIYAAFARGAAAANVFLGALEPNEGFGMAGWHDSWKEGDTYCREAMYHAIGAAAGLLRHTPGWAPTNISIGYGLLRGWAVVAGRAAFRSFLLDGPSVVDTIYGDLPTRCGCLSKGKDRAILRGSISPPSGSTQITEIRHLWAVLHGNDPHEPTISRSAVVQKEILKGERQPYLIGLSLDFSNSGDEFACDPHRARVVVDQLLTSFESLVSEIPGLFVSPRYGDGLGAVIALEASGLRDILRYEQVWRVKLVHFCRLAAEALTGCRTMGLRIGMSIDLDSTACTVRLAGVNRITSPAVEPLAASVLTNARLCHRLAKDAANPRQDESKVRWLYLPRNSRKMRSLSFK